MFPEKSDYFPLGTAGGKTDNISFGESRSVFPQGTHLLLNSRGSESINWVLKY